MDLNEILSVYDLDSEANPYGDGHINDTYLLSHDHYILQKINTNVFKNADELMENISGVTGFLREKIKEAGGNPDRETLTLIKTKDGSNYYQAKDGGCYRIYKRIKDALSYNNVENPTQFYNAAKAFGRFQQLLAEYPADKLHETIPHFHDTPDRYRQLDEAIKADVKGRVSEVKEEIDFVMARREEAGSVVKAIASGEIPLRVTHNDTKLNNVMLDINTGDAVCVIDLDTVMPGSLLYDYGDALRFGASSGAEDETDLSKIWFNLEFYEAFTKGYLEEVGKILTPKERELLPFSAKLLTLECGVRFLTDYINGDTYFKIHREKHNLERARNQFKLVSDIETKIDDMKKIVDKYMD